MGDLDRERTVFVLAATSAGSQAHVLSYEQRLPDGRDSGWTGQVGVDALYRWPQQFLQVPGVQPDAAARTWGWQQVELLLWPARVAGVGCCHGDVVALRLTTS